MSCKVSAGADFGVRSQCGLQIPRQGSSRDATSGRHFRLRHDQRRGNIEESLKANVAVVQVFPLMIAATLIVIILQVRSLSTMTMVMLTAPLGLAGVVPALLLFNQPFGFNAILGLIGLAGICTLRLAAGMMAAFNISEYCCDRSFYMCRERDNILALIYERGI